jgi:hypothetical protein
VLSPICRHAPRHPKTFVLQSATVYDADTCEQMKTKLIEIQQRVLVVSGQQDQKRKIDQAAVGVGLVLFWPALVAMPLSKDHKHELGELKGQYEALVRAGESKHCPV